MDDSAEHLNQAMFLVETIVGRMSAGGRERLILQARTMSNLTGNLAFLSFEVDRQSTEPEPDIPNPIPYRPEVVGADGTSFGELMVWRDQAGYIDTLEFTWWGDHPPTRLPSLAELRLP
jgi:hypothetical protein